MTIPTPAPAASGPPAPAPRGRPWGQLIRFALVGGVNTGTYYVFYLALLSGAGLPYVVAHVIAFVLSMIGSFFLNSWFTYRTRPTLRKFLLFPLTNVANFVITTGGVYVLVDLLGMNDTYAPLVAAAAAVPITFVVSRTIMTRPDERAGSRQPEALTHPVRG
ncbi:GtrA family protein [Streptomyces sp. DW26H14]|uniref:GtrA family protein n=1 Tax=Streptomyces sp. DW26H14 TaxID=3435395 RepID=UPI00403DF865